MFIAIAFTRVFTAVKIYFSIKVSSKKRSNECHLLKLPRRVSFLKQFWTLMKLILIFTYFVWYLVAIDEGRIEMHSVTRQGRGRPPINQAKTVGYIVLPIQTAPNTYLLYLMNCDMTLLIFIFDCVKKAKDFDTSVFILKQMQVEVGAGRSSQRGHRFVLDRKRSPSECPSSD